MQMPSSGGAAWLVAAGILLSRLAGLIRQRVLGYYLATSPAADAYTAALRIPNFLQNLLGEGVLSACCLGVLNSHHRFFLSYAAPVVWSAAIIVALVLGAHAGPPRDQARIAIW